eukprot:TRINITY_DN203_c0_g2_i4.p2 TRINITY_DN203_c0_g2~~TRINITY_DN203_c0_g2_i4.p2  ORF type:complete len:127 (+),score=33.06 TRINITY_DN203_c0_g2_i4:79-459(+)
MKRSLVCIALLLASTLAADVSDEDASRLGNKRVDEADETEGKARRVGKGGYGGGWGHHGGGWGRHGGGRYYLNQENATENTDDDSKDLADEDWYHHYYHPYHHYYHHYYLNQQKADEDWYHHYYHP